MSDYLTTKEAAALLRIKDRKLYDLASKGRIPCSRAMGKLLFERAALDAWVAAGGEAAAPPQIDRPTVVLGSHDPLLDWALRESGSGLATYVDGSLDGLARFTTGEGIAAGLHVHDASTETWNEQVVRDRASGSNAVLVEWAWRQRGLIVSPGNSTIHNVSDLHGQMVAHRQASAGGQHLFERLLAEANATPSPDSPITRTETDAALAVADGTVAATFGLAAVAAQFRLGFLPILQERFDLLVDRAAWFDPPFQALILFTRSPAFTERAASLSGYDISGLWTVHVNGP